jgi:ADP-heptose:LPS heptosyltransferase
MHIMHFMAHFGHPSYDGLSLSPSPPLFPKTMFIPMKILIIKLGALGDMVMATPFVESIQRHHEGDDVYLLTSPPYTSIFRDWPGIILKSFPRKKILSSILTALWIRKNHFRRIYDLQSNDRTSVFCALSGTQECIGNHPRFPYNIHPEETYKGQCHIFERMRSVLSSAGVNCTSSTPRLPINAAGKEHVYSWLNENKLEDKLFIVLHAGASPDHPKKYWPFYLQFAKLLNEHDLQVVWVGADTDVNLNDTLSKEIGLNATNVFTLAELAELGRHARFAVTNDSGPMHVFSCSDIPVYAFFGPTNWRRNHAIGQGHNVITLQPDDIVGKIIKDPAISDLGNITTQQVINRLEQDNML